MTGYVQDPRDAVVAPEVVNQQSLYAMHSVFSTTAPLPASASADAVSSAIAESGAEVRGFYDVGGFRAEADLLVWMVADAPEKLQAAYHAIRRSELGEYLEPVWSVVSLHRPAEFNKSHVPSCFSGVAPRPWICVYPFVRSYEWYVLPSEERAAMLREHGMAAHGFPDVKASTLSGFALGDYEWILSFEADELHRLVDIMHHLRATQARLHVREETPFFTGQRVELSDWLERQPQR